MLQCTACYCPRVSLPEDDRRAETQRGDTAAPAALLLTLPKHVGEHIVLRNVAVPMRKYVLGVNWAALPAPPLAALPARARGPGWQEQSVPLA